MGRHSAPEDQEPFEAPAGGGREAARGRHESAEPVAETAASRPPREGATHADLRLLREHAGLRARCAAAAIVPFLLYTAALFVIGRTDVYLVWVWIPTVLAGVAVGGFLDGAHRREGKNSAG